MSRSVSGYRHLGREVFPDPARRVDAGQSMADEWSNRILARWNAGHRHGRRLHADLQAEGWRGSYSSLARYLRRLRKAAGTPARPRPWVKPATTVVRTRPLTPKAVAWTVLRPLGKRDELDAATIERLRADSPVLAELIDLAEAFTSLIRNRSADKLDPWLRRAQDGASPVLRRFAEKLVGDGDAVRAAGDAAMEQRAGRGTDQPPQPPETPNVRPRQARSPEPTLPSRRLKRPGRDHGKWPRT